MPNIGTIPRGPEEDPRLRRFMAQISQIMNSLTALEVFVQTGGGSWALDPLLTDIMDLVDPGADRILFWDDSAGHLVFLATGNGITITNTSILLTAMAQATVKGRAVGAGTGDPADLTAAELVTLINTADGAGSLLDADLVDGWQLSDIQAFASAMG